MNFFLYDDSGRIHEAGYCPDSMYKLQARPGLHLGKGTAGFNTHYVVNGEPVAMPPKPSDFAVFNYQTLQWDVDTTRAEAAVRKERDTLIAATDWTQLPDVSQETRELWATYRQALRDVTLQEGFPLAVVWPDQPK